MKIVPRYSFLKHGNIILSHVIYKAKRLCDVSLKIKLRIAPHCYRDQKRSILKTDSASYPAVGICIVVFIATFHKWRPVKIDFISAILRTGRALRDVYVIPPFELGDKKFLWLLFAAAYGLVNVDAKWQKRSGDSMKSIRFTQQVYVPQLCYNKRHEVLTSSTVKAVDDVLFASEDAEIGSVVEYIQRKSKHSNFVQGPS